MTESQIQKQIFNELVLRGYLVIRVNSGAATGTYKNKKRFIQFVTWRILGMVLQRAGVSDLIAIQPPGGRFVAIEVKRPDKKDNLSDSQRRFGAAVQQVGGLFLVASGVDDLAPLFNELNVIFD